MAAPITKRKKPFNIAPWLPTITVVAGLGYLSAGYFLLLKPAIGPILPGGQYDFAPLEQRVTENKEYSAKMRTALADYDNLSPETKQRLKSMVPTDVDFPNLMVQIDALATRHSMLMLSLDAVADDKSLAASGRKAVRLAINLSTGSYDTLKAMLGDLERSLRLIDATNVTFTPATEAASEGGFNLSARTYLLDLVASAAAKTAAKKPTTAETE